MSATAGGHGLGWLADYPEHRDFGPNQSVVPERVKQMGQGASVNDMLAKIGVASPVAALPGSIDLRQWCAPIEDQGTIGSCTAQAGAGMIEYFERRAFGRHVDASRLFLYKVTRRLAHLTGDTGAYLRSTMGAMVLFGVPPEEYWPYSIEQFDQEPPAFCYSFARSFQTLSYYRLDPPATVRSDLLAAIKTHLAAALPSMFGFTVFSSISQAGSSGEIPFPSASDPVSGGHAVVAVGYDDGKTITNSAPGAESTTGALLIRNSWGTGWGDDGYGWIPYAYVLEGLAVDWWSLLKAEWVDTGQFAMS